MTAKEKTWVWARDTYLNQVRKVLSAARYPGSKGIIEEVRQHLESRYAELPQESRNWEGYQQIITEMGPPSDYVDLLGMGRLRKRIVTWRRIAVAVPVILIVLGWAWYHGLIPLGIYNGPRTYVIPEMVGAPWQQPFVDDARIIGKWESVGFVAAPSEFVPGGNWPQRRAWLRELTFLEGGTMVAVMNGGRPATWQWGSRCKWTKDWIIDIDSRIQAQYEIKDIAGNTYLFYPWLSGDVTIRYMPPKYYVLKKVAATEQPKVAPVDGTVKFDGKPEAFDIDKATLDDVIKAFGEPKQYVWGKEEFTEDKLPAQYIAKYDKGFSVFMVQGKVMELRHEGPDGFSLAGRLKLGDKIDDAVALLGKPQGTVKGKPVGWEDSVIYIDIDGKKGDCYYARSDKSVRLFFSDYRIAAIYTTRSDFFDEQEKASPEAKPAAVREFDDVRGKNLSALDLAAQPGIVATLQFDERTIWPKALPAGQSPQDIMKAAMNPGLGVRGLHKQGITGKGVSVAIIDQPLYQDHPEFAGKIAKYIDVGCGSETSMHGPAVASLLVGNDCGTAPDATLYYVAAPSWLADASYYAKALDMLVEISDKLPAAQKIRAVSVSAAPSGRGSPFKKNGDMWDKSREKAEKAGMLILDCTTDKGFIAPGYYDATAPDDISKCRAGFPNIPGRASDRIAAPCSRRTTAQEFSRGEFTHAYWGQGGLSWSIPYATGVLAMGWQVAPDLSADQMKELLIASAYGDARFIDPVKFVEMAQARAKGIGTKDSPQINTDSH
jgi:serine protease AprX